MHMNIYVYLYINIWGHAMSAYIAFCFGSNACKQGKLQLEGWAQD